MHGCKTMHCRVQSLFFFFSSRRRHTRYWRDWSSDVCSSDLAWAREHIRPLVDQHGRGWATWSADVAQRVAAIAEAVPAGQLDDAATELARLAEDVETRRRVVELLIEERRERRV